jgi:hypothetical protein
LTIKDGFLGQRVPGVQRYGREIVAELDRLLEDDRLTSSLCAKIELGPALRAIAFEQTARRCHQLAIPFDTQGAFC